MRCCSSPTGNAPQRNSVRHVGGRFRAKATSSGVVPRSAQRRVKVCQNIVESFQNSIDKLLNVWYTGDWIITDPVGVASTEAVATPFTSGNAKSFFLP